MDDQIIKYITGEEDYQDCWFGETPEGKVGRFWWRRELRKYLDHKEVEIINLQREINRLKERIETATLVLNEGTQEI